MGRRSWRPLTSTTPLLRPTPPRPWSPPTPLQSTLLPTLQSLSPTPLPSLLLTLLQTPSPDTLWLPPQWEPPTPLPGPLSRPWPAPPREGGRQTWLGYPSDLQHLFHVPCSTVQKGLIVLQSPRLATVTQPGSRGKHGALIFVLDAQFYQFIC